MGKYSLKKRKGIRKQQSFKKRKGGALGVPDLGIYKNTLGKGLDKNLANIEF